MTTGALTEAIRGLPPGAVDLARHAAVPVALDARFLNLLRVNFFVDIPVPLPYETEAALLLSPVVREIGEGLYEVDPALRNTLLSELVSEFGGDRLGRVAALLEQYTDRSAAWHALPELENAQRLTALSLLDPERAHEWLQREKEASAEVGTALGHSWFVAMENRLLQQQTALLPAPPPTAIPWITVAIVTEPGPPNDLLDDVIDEVFDYRFLRSLKCQVGVIPSEIDPDHGHGVVLAAVNEGASADRVVDELIREFPELRTIIVAGTFPADSDPEAYEIVVARRVVAGSEGMSQVPGIDYGLLSAASGPAIPAAVVWPAHETGAVPTVRTATFVGPNQFAEPGVVVDRFSPAITAAADAQGLSWFVVQGTPNDGPARACVAAYLRALVSTAGSFGDRLPSPDPEWAASTTGALSTADPVSPRSALDATVGIITALPVEAHAVRSVLDDARPTMIAGDPTRYVLGSVPGPEPGHEHTVVLATLPPDGTRSAATLATTMARSFPGLRLVIICGIAAGIRRSAGEEEIRLGDIVVATDGIVDFGHTRTADGPEPRPLGRTPPSTLLLAADRRLQASEAAGAMPWLETVHRLAAIPSFMRPDSDADDPTVHRAAIGSTDMLLRSSRIRAELARQYEVVALEMEGAGIAAGAVRTGRSWFMVRGISDFGDDSKSDSWQGYAALTAAAYTRSLLAEYPAQGPERAPNVR
ncbi:hypothetical protein [Actinoplanes sp. GCM10030250]|uniref:5'-methylthioadenosine/S-adenosylhomocysteine nucleosidase family protein n=1 Tax=Actinoplanes sp. GCM10030250 TaxID=3273376 RepID=UPI0036088F11